MSTINKVIETLYETGLQKIVCPYLKESNYTTHVSMSERSVLKQY